MKEQVFIGNPRFFNCTGPHSLAVVAEAAQCAFPTRNRLIVGLASLSLAEPDEISFVTNGRHAAALATTRAGAVLVQESMAASVPPETVPLIIADPVEGWAHVAALFHPVSQNSPGIHPSAVVSVAAQVDEAAEICAHVLIEAGAIIGPGCKVGAGTVIGSGVTLGRDCRIGPHVTISHATLGARVYVYAGARIGQEGFGFSITSKGFKTVPQLGSVIIGDDVEVGANTTIDRGALGNTVIGSGTRLDNQVQIAHGVQIGRHCAIAALVGISGSAEIGDGVVVGGQAGLAEHVLVGPRCRIGAQSGVMSDIEPDSVIVGSPARPIREVFREIAVLKKLARASQKRSH